MSYFKKWDIMRVLRLVVGMFIVVQGIQMGDWQLMALGGLFSLMPLFNVGCCGNAGCHTMPKLKHNQKIEDITYEEVR